jgi:DedD protein
MEEKNELNDIILNKGGSGNNNKKIILSVAILGVILIIVVMLMSSLTSNGTDNLPQAVLPPEPKAQAQTDKADEPLFEEVEVVEENTQDNDNLDQIAQKLKEESKTEVEVIEPVINDVKKEETVQVQQETIQKPAPSKVVAQQEAKSAPVTKPAQVSSSKQFYIQVGSFSKYAPNKKFLQDITNKGFSYTYHKVTRNSRTLTKVLVGPFANEREARVALRTIRSNIEAGAFLTKLKL